MLAKGISKPIPFKNLCIAFAAACGLAVNTNISVLPNLSLNDLALLKKGPFLPSTTSLNCLKSNVAPSRSKNSDCVANSVAFISLTLPSGMLTIILLFVLANVSSKSNTLIPF